MHVSRYSRYFQYSNQSVVIKDIITVVLVSLSCSVAYFIHFYFSFCVCVFVLCLAELEESRDFKLRITDVSQDYHS